MGDVRKGPVAVVVKQLVRPERGPVQVDPAVVIEVSHGHAHAVAVGRQSTLRRDIGEMHGARPIRVHHEVVPIEPIRQRAFRRSEQRRPGPEQSALHEIDVEVAVVVVIEQRDAGPHDLGLIELPGHAVEVDEVDPRRRRLIDEPLFVARIGPDGGRSVHGVRGSRLFGSRRGGLGRAGGRSTTQDQQEEQWRAGRAVSRSHAHGAVSLHRTSPVGLEALSPLSYPSKLRSQTLVRNNSPTALPSVTTPAIARAAGPHHSVRDASAVVSGIALQGPAFAPDGASARKQLRQAGQERSQGGKAGKAGSNSESRIWNSRGARLDRARPVFFCLTSWPDLPLTASYGGRKFQTEFFVFFRARRHFSSALTFGICSGYRSHVGPTERLAFRRFECVHVRGSVVAIPLFSVTEP